VVAPGKQPQALGRLVDQLGFGQDAAADRDHGVGREEVGAVDLVASADPGERRLGLGVGETVGTHARQLAPLRGLVDIGRAQLVGLDAGLVDQADAARRAGGENEFGTADHGEVDAGLARKLRGRAAPVLERKSCGRGSMPRLAGDRALLQVVGPGRGS